MNSIDGIAVIGMSCRFPGADGPDEYWRLLESGTEAVVRLDERTLIAAGEDPQLLTDPDYVPAHGVLDGSDLFDAAFFGMSPGEAAVLDPQHRLFLECVWTAFEDAGYDPKAVPGPVSVYAGSGWNSYFLRNVASHPEFLEPGALQRTLLGNESDTLATRVSYKLGLTGPSMTVQTACSTSLVAVAQACQSLLSQESDMALAGGVSIRTPQAGYLHQEGSIFSRTGQCRAFDASADGTVIGSGAGVVLLKRLEDALADGDHIHAVIKGAAVNNDGSSKAGYAAPSVDGQSAVIREAQALAGFSPETITYVETHGTGTALGDPIEIAALTDAFRAGTDNAGTDNAGADKTGYCALGSVKTNIGHLDAAAGVAGLIKTVLALKNKTIPPSLHFERPNPAIDFTTGPFHVNTTATAWDTGTAPRRAGVSSFGIGGTNAHVVLEEAPAVRRTAPGTAPQLLPLSARTAAALDRRTEELRDHLRQGQEFGVADIAYTLQGGRRAFAHRRAVVAGTVDEAVRALSASLSAQPGPAFLEGRQVAFMFSGQGSQHVGMARRLYATHSTYREEANRCFDLLRSRHGLDLRALIHPQDESRVDEYDAALTRTSNAQPALFVVQYALARTLMRLGVPMAAGVGHSFGEYAAAALAGVFTLEDALSLVVARGRLLAELPGGSMMAVPLEPGELEPLLGPDLSIAVVNHPTSCVVAGPRASVEELREALAARDVDATVLRISYASHSAMVEPVLEPFAREFAGIRLRPPRVPFLSSVTGTWITDEQATDPQYWVTHLRARVRFADGLQRVFKETDHVLVEVGPSETLTGLARRHPAADPGRVAQPVLPRRTAAEPDDVVFLRSLGWLWSSGVDLDWEALHPTGGRRRVPLPTYPFERQRHWIAPHRATAPGNDLFTTAVREGREEAGARLNACDLAQRQAKTAALDRLSAAYMTDAVHKLAPDSPHGSAVEQGEFVRRCRVLPAYRPLLNEWLDELTRRDRLRRDSAGRITGLTAYAPDELDELLRQARQAWPGEPEVELVQRCGTAAAEALRGEADPVDLFTPLLDRAFAEPGEIFGTEYAAVIRRAVAGVLKTPRAADGLQLLEIGGGTGITTSQLTEVLAGESGAHQYVFTDVSETFVSRAGRRYGELPWFSAQQLDIEKPPAAQGFRSGTFDVVIAANVLHATGDLTRTLEHVRSLLAPGGILLLAEITTPTLDFALSYSLLMGQVTDHDRTRSAPFLSREQWERRLSIVFAHTASTLDDDALGHHVIVAEAPSAPHGAPVSGAAGGEGLRKRNDVTEWFRVPSWKRTAAVRRAGEPAAPSGTWLVLGQESAMDDAFLSHLRRQEQPVVTVRRGPGYRRCDASTYEVRPHVVADHELLLADLASEDRLPTRIVHMWGVGEPEPGPEDPTAGRDWRSLIALAKAVDQRGLSRPVDLTVVSTGMHDVLGERTDVGKSLLLGPSRVIPLEYPDVTSRSVDIVLGGQEPDRLALVAAQLADEVRAAPSDEVVAYRGGHRWVETVAPVSLEDPGGRTVLRENGVYLITGGLGTIGTSIAQHLVTTVGAKVVLVGRSAPDHTSGDTAPWYEGRPDVLVMAADVTDAERMRTVVETGEARFGPVNGVIHSAGVLGDGSIAQKTFEDFEAVLAPKVTGTLVLHELFKDKSLDFFVLFSSLSSRKPGFGQAAYAAANCFLDSFVHSELAAHHTLATCVNWDVWQGSGMAYDAAGPKVLQQLKHADLAERGILAHQGVDALSRILASGLTHVYVTSSDYLDVLDHPRRDLSQVYLEAIEHESAVRQQARPEQDAAYVPPRTTTEHMLTDIWQGLLGIDRIGASDDFFQLGGDSLLGSQFVTRVRNAFGIHLPARTLYEHPTLEALAKVVDDALLTNAHPDAVAEAIRQVKSER
ncbi:type I polyketide synthase [Streptomyces sp. CC224B]|uniref:type I polyketide synthase n=1 Tax=Streptomyces sp. CC224B TaxID=3044571 RepID=UPI0024A7FC2C|nr:type I polyketide synthase [Streptomyces sp. CC224B]